LRIKRLIFASSLAACSFPAKGKMINEKSKADADYAYARTKRQGEEMLKEYSRYFNCTIVRFAAIFSDWCEYAPLYKFLATWISNKWDSRIIGGKGNSAISYLHINDLICIILKIIEKTDLFLPSILTLQVLMVLHHTKYSIKTQQKTIMERIFIHYLFQNQLLISVY
jgi:nucleoside-diphosphate-sugar epimerase